MAIERVERLLRDATTALRDAGIPYAVVGGNAVAAWVMTVDDGAVRATKDVDVLLRREHLSDVTAALAPLGLIPVEVLGVVMFVDRDRPNPKTGLHIVFAGEHIRAHYKHPAPDVDASVDAEDGFRIVKLAALVTMKLQSFRDIDRAHIRDLLSVGLIDPTLESELPADLATRLDDIRRTE